MHLPAAAPEPSIIRSTLRALLQPRRLIPILLVSASLVAAQASYSHDPLAIPLGIAMCLAFVLVAPVSWRVLFPDRLDLSHGGDPPAALRRHRRGRGAGRSASSRRACSAWARRCSPRRRAWSSALALFLVGGWGLGRDIGSRASLARASARGGALAREAERAQLLALRAHLDPHFLFNTLNAIAEWCREDGETAERAVLQLSAMLRTVLAGVRAADLAARRRAGAGATRCSSCTSCATRDRVRADAARCPSRCRDVAGAAAAAAAAGRERGQARPRRRPPRHDRAERAPLRADERLMRVDREPGRLPRAARRAATGCPSSSGGWRSPTTAARR